MTRTIDVINRFIEEFQSRGDEAAAQELLADDFVDHTPFPGFGPTRSDVMNLFSTLRSAFPDLRCEVEEQIANGDRVATHKTFHGTHQGALAGIEPTHRRIRIVVIDIVRIADGKIREHWNVVDLDALMNRLRT